MFTIEIYLREANKNALNYPPKKIKNTVNSQINQYHNIP
jgi:hypothetical protein